MQEKALGLTRLDETRSQNLYISDYIILALS